MKNKIIIDIDSDRQPRVVLSKPSDVVLPTNPKETTEMLIEDIACVCETLCSMIQVAHNNGYVKKENLVNQCVIYLNTLLESPPLDNVNEK